MEETSRTVCTRGLVYKDINYVKQYGLLFRAGSPVGYKGWATEANARNYKGGQYDNFRSPNIIYYTDIQKSNHRPYNPCRKHGNRIQ